MTERLYYSDPILLEFEAVIVESGEHEGGRHYTVLNRSAFYPTSGGQSHDTGSLNGIAVIDVIEEESGVVRHITARPVGAAGAKVSGHVDPDRRLRNRQLHTAQHILSEAFIKLYDYHTVSVHLGDEYGAVELDTAEVDEPQLAAVERQANQIVQQNDPVEILSLEKAQAEALPLRKKLDREGSIRVIRIGEFDWSACGGTHCLETAEVGMIKITGTEKMRRRVLVKFLAGSQVTADYALRFTVTDELARSMTCHVADLPGRVEKLTSENKDLRRQLAGMQKQLLPTRAERMAAKTQKFGRLRLVAQVVDDLEPSVAGQLASMVAGRIGGLAMLVCGDRLLLAVGPDSGLHAGKLMKDLAAGTNLRGGGGQSAAQAGGAEADRLDDYLAAVGELIADD